MTREIKFKVWDKKNKEWVGAETGGVMDLLYSMQYNGFFFDNDSFDIPERIEVLQFTGLKDKNGKEIYEGDVVKIEREYYPINPVIYYAGIVNEHDGDWDEWYCGFCLDDVDYTPLSEDVEVIGNVYMNPELLKGE